MKKTKLILLALPLFALAACSAGYGPRIDYYTAMERAEDIDAAHARYGVRNAKVTVSQTMSKGSASQTQQMDFSVNSQGDVYYKVVEKYSSGGMSSNVTRECYNVNNVKGYGTVTYIKITQGTASTVKTYINGNYSYSDVDYFPSDIFDDPFYMITNYYYSEARYIVDFYENLPGVSVTVSYYSKGRGSLTVVMKTSQSNNKPYNSSNYDDDYYTYKSFNMTAIYSNYLMQEITGDGTTVDDIKQKATQKYSYPNSLSINLPSGWQNTIVY